MVKNPVRRRFSTRRVAAAALRRNIMEPASAQSAAATDEGALLKRLIQVGIALTSQRCYKPPMPIEEACEIIRKGVGTHFDPQLAEIFFKRLPVLLEIRDAHPG
jgi:hypothetical protein